jgi:ribosome biogenesis GTPase
VISQAGVQHSTNSLGLKYLTLWEMDGAEIAEPFVEMRAYLGQCKFGADCAHDHEPDCAVKRAVDAGVISEQRYTSYLRIREKMNV